MALLELSSEKQGIRRYSLAFTRQTCVEPLRSCEESRALRSEDALCVPQKSCARTPSPVRRPVAMHRGECVCSARGSAHTAEQDRLSEGDSVFLGKGT